ncbi:MAG: ABC transporter permease [Clostridia bacterium]|nr:ABC transporter permease [Clostridia bacterium]
MKKKLTINSLALGNLKQRRKQYTILIIGIILAIVFSSGTLFFISCNQSSNEEFKRRNIGDYFGYYFNPPEIFDIEGGKKDGYIEKYGYAHILGYAYTDAEEIDKGTPIAWLDDNAKDLYYVTLKEGKYPENKGEIALEADAALRLGINAKIGEEISLSILNANGTDFSTTATEKTYKIVGILTDKRKNLEYYSDTTPTIPAAFVSEKEEVDVGGKEILALYFNPTEESCEAKMKVQEDDYYYESNAFEQNFLFKFYETMREQTGSDGILDIITNVNSFYFNMSDAVFNSSILTITLTVVLMIASCIGIINAFSTNLQERRKQIGMLRAVGATRRQIINIFGRETFIIALICAPIGVAISYFGVKLFATIMGEDFIFIPDLTVLFGSAAISIVCVMLAALIPLFSASRISPMQAIRNVELTRKMKRQNIKTEKEFNVPKLLANRSIKFYKGKQVGVSIILALTIFMSCFGLSGLKTEMNNNMWSVLNPSDYVIDRRIFAHAIRGINYPNMDKKISLNMVQDVLDYPKFTNIRGYKECVSYLTVDEYSDYLTLVDFSATNRYGSNTDYTKDELEGLSFEELCDVWLTGESNYYLELKEKTKSEQELFRMDIVGYDEQILEKYENQFEVIDGKIDIDKLNSGEEIILVANEEIGLGVSFDKDNVVYTYGLYNLDNELPEWFHREGYKIYASQELEYKAGDTINLRTITSDATEVPEDDYMVPGNLTVYDKEVKIGAIIARPVEITASDLYPRGDVCVFTTTTGIEKVAGAPVGYERLFIDYDGTLDDDADTAAINHLESLVAGDCEIESGYATNQENQSWVRTLMISLLAIVILFFSICASIVNNALTAKIRESKKEIGTLRAVGASVKEITISYVRQLISMFSWGCGIGFIGYILTHIIFYKIFELTFEIWPAVIICVLLFSMCSLNLYLKIKKEMKNSIVDNIREL